MSFHHEYVSSDIHVPNAFTYVDETDRQNATGLTVDDEGKLARQDSDGTYWVLEDFTGPTWAVFGGAGGGGGTGLPTYFRGLLNSTPDVNNLTPLAIPWDGATVKSADITHDPVGANPSRVQVDTDGVFELNASVIYESTGGGLRAVVDLSVSVNGVAVPSAGTGGGGYGRSTLSYGAMSSIHTLLVLTSGDYVEVIATNGGNAGPNFALADRSVITLTKITADAVGSEGNLLKSTHKTLTGADIHVPHAFTYANATERLTATGFVASDLGKIARQEIDQSYWVLEDVTPLWKAFGGGGGSSELSFDSITDPAVDAAVTSAVIDVHSGTVITLTTAGNSQTLEAPTDTTAGKRFVIVNDDASTDSIVVNGALIQAGEFVTFHWDGTAWIALGGVIATSPGGPTGAMQFNSAGVLGGVTENLWDDVAKRQTVLGDIEQVGGIPTNLYTPVQVSATPTGANPRRAVVQGNYLYVCDANDNDLRIFDVTDPAAPVQVGSVVIGGGRGLDVAGDFVYYADEDNGGRLVIVNVQDKSAPFIAGAVVLGGSARGVVVRGTLAFISFNLATNGVKAIDVSDPPNPVELGQFSPSGGGRAEMDVTGDILVLTHSFGINLIDISDPSNLSSISFIDPGVTTWAAQVQGRYLYTADESPDTFQVWDIVDPTTPVQVGTLALTAPSSVRAISVSGNFAYLGDASNDSILVVDISDPTAPVAISTETSAGLNPISITTVGRYAYVLDNNGDQFLIFDLRGIDAQNLNVGNIDVGNINLRRNLKAAGSITTSGLGVGSGGINSSGPVAVQGHTVARAAQNVVEIYLDTDFPNDGSVISPVAGVEYVLMAPISTAMQIAIPAAGGAFTPTVIRSTSKSLNTLTSTGTGTAFILGASAQGQLVLQNLVIQQVGGARVFATLQSLTNQTDSLLELDDTSISDFDSGSTFTNCIFNVNNNSFVTASGTFKLIDCEATWAGMFTANFTDTAEPTLDVKSSSGSTTPSLVTIRDSKLSSQVNESFFMLHSNLIAGSIVRLPGGIEASPFTPGTGGFYDVQTGSITSLADSGGAPGVRTVCTSTLHDVADGDTVVHAGFTTQTQMNGTFVVSDVIPGVSYEVVAVFGGTDTGTFSNASLDQKDVRVSAFANPGQQDSKAIGSFHVNSNATATVIAAALTFVNLNLGGNALAGSNIERWTLTDATTGEMRYDGLQPFSGTLLAQVSLQAAGGSPAYAFRVVKNGAVLPDGIETTVETPDALTVVGVGLLAPVMVVNGDLIRLQVANQDGTDDVTISHLSVSIQ